LAAHLREEPAPGLADVAFTLAAGRRAFRYRRAVVSRSKAEAIEALESPDPPRESPAPSTTVTRLAREASGEA